MTVTNQQPIKKKLMLVPQYMQNFSCIGSDCEDSCCTGWRVNLDEATYKQYNRVRDTELTPLIEKHVNRVRSNASTNNYGKIKLEKDGSCPFLSEQKLCSIQLKLGEQFLSSTCSTYPRILNQVNDVFEKSATTSCPEVARLALLNPNGIEFDEIEEFVDSRSITHKTIKTNNKTSNKVDKYFWELRIFTIQVLQNRSYSLWERLIILGMFYQRVDEMIQTKNIDDIPRQIWVYSALIEDESLRNDLSNIPARYQVQMDLTKKLSDVRYLQGISNKRYLECFNETLLGIHCVEGTSIETMSEHYTAAYADYYEPFMNDHHYILENYLVNYVYKNMFPLGGHQSVYEAYVVMIVHYAMIKLHLIGMAGFHKGLTTDLAVKLIQSFAKTVEHNSLYVRNIFNLLKDNGYTSIAYISILIKN